MPSLKFNHLKMLTGLGFLLTLAVTGAEIYRQGNEATQIIESMLKKTDPRIRPDLGGDPIVVGVTAYVLRVDEMDLMKMELTWDFYFRQMWNDQRLSFKGPPAKLNLGGDLADKIWTPDTFVVNEKWSETPDSRNSESFVRLSENGDVLYSRRLLKTGTCPLDFSYFPMDVQICTLEFESFGNSMAEFKYNLTKGPQSFGISNDVSLPEVRVVAHKINIMELFLSSGNYSRVEFKIALKRAKGFYICRWYFPAIFTVLLSWLAFWINSKYFGIRFASAVISAIAITLLSFCVNDQLPKIRYSTAIGVYLNFCCVMIFLTIPVLILIEYLVSKNNDEGQTDVEGGFLAKLKEIRINPQLIEICFQIGLPVCIIIFNIYYWSTYKTDLEWIQDPKNGWVLL